MLLRVKLVVPTPRRRAYQPLRGDRARKDPYARLSAHKIRSISASALTDPSPPGAVTAVIATLHSAARLESTVALLTDDPALREVIVVHDGDGEPPAHDGAGGTAGVRTLITHRVGPSFARQQGLEASSGPIVLLLDDDVRPHAGLVSDHAEHHAAPGLVVVGYMPVAEPQDASAEPIPTMLYRQEYLARVAAYESDPASILRHLWAGNVSMRREDALRVGLASTAFPGRRHEDRDLGLRCLAAGMTGVFDRSLAATHEYRRSNRAFLEDARAQGAERFLLHEAHVELIGDLDPRAFSGDLPAALGLLVRGLGRPCLDRCAAEVLLFVTALATACRWRRAAVAALKFARRVQQQAGAREADRRVRATRDAR